MLCSIQRRGAVFLISIKLQIPYYCRSISIIVGQFDMIAHITARSLILKSLTDVCRKSQVISHLRQIIGSKLVIRSDYAFVSIAANIDRNIHRCDRDRVCGIRIFFPLSIKNRICAQCRSIHIFLSEFLIQIPAIKFISLF